MKRLVSVVLIFAILLGTCAPVTLNAANTNDGDDIYKSISSDISYTDLFSVYSNYLSSNTFIDTMNTETQGALVQAYNGFKNSDRYGDMLESTAFGDSGITDLLKLLGDGFGITNFTYNEALDEANERILNEMFGSQVAMDTYGTDKRIYEYMNRGAEFLSELFSDIEIEKEVEIDTLELLDILRHTEDNLDRYWDKIPDITTTREVFKYCIENVDKLETIFKVGTQAIVIVKAIYLAIMIETVRGDIIEDMLESAVPGTAFYDGMTRLNHQMGNNFVDYIIRYYFENGIIEELTDAAEDWVIGKMLGNNAMSFNLIMLVLNVAMFIKHDLILNTPEFSEVTSFVILGRYASDLYNCITTMEDSLSTTCLKPNTITRYENLWKMYNSVNEAAWELGKTVAAGADLEHLNFIFEIYYTGDFDLYSEFINYVIDKIESIPVTEREITPVECYQYDYDDISYYNFDKATDLIEADTVYGVGEFLYGDLKVTKRQYPDPYLGRSIFDGIDGIWGDLTVKGESFTIPKDTEFTVRGDVIVTGFWSGGYNHEGVLSNLGKLYVYGDVYTDVDYTQYGFSMGNDAELWLYGDYSLPWFTNYGGTVICDGNETQHLYGEFKNLTVYNPAGVDGSIDLYGHFDLGSNPFFGTVNLFDGGSFEDGSNYRDVQVKADYTMRSSIPADNVTVYGVKLTVPADGDYTIDGNVILGGYISGTNIKKGILEVNGSLTVTGDVARMNDTNTYCEFFMNNEDSFFEIKGDQNVGITHGSGGTVLFSGVRKQNACGNYHNITVTNPVGITGDIVLYGHFDLNGNPYDGRVTLREGTFADGSNYNEVYIETDQTLRSNIPADMVEIYRATLTVPEGTDYEIDGDIYLGGYIYGQYSYYGILDVSGALTVGGDVSNIEGNNYYRINAYNGSVIRFSGNGAQYITPYISGYTVILENESDEGVIFKGGLGVNTLFDHNRNNYSINGTGIFTDYDKDGIIDSEDMVPEAVRGDVNGDGNINALDSNELSKIIAGNTGIRGFEAVYNADINGDGFVNSIDSNLIKRRLVGV